MTPDQKIANSIPGRPPSGEPLAAQWRGYPIVGQNLVSGLVHMYVPSLCSCANSITISKKLYYFYFKILGKIHIFLITSLLHGRSFNNGLTSISSLILTKAQHRFVLDFHSVVYDVVRASRNVTFSRAKLCRICMKSALIFSQFWLLRT